MPSYVGQRESERLEFKRAADHDESVLKAIVAMLNTSGGTLVIGVDAPNGQPAIAVPGVPQPHEYREKLQKRVLDRIEPAPRHLCTVEVDEGDGGVPVVVARITGSQRLHALRLGSGAYLVPTREGDESRPLSFTEILERGRAPAADASEHRDAAIRRTIDFVQEMETLPSAGQRVFCIWLAPSTRLSGADETWMAVRTRLLERLGERNPFGEVGGTRPSGWTIGLAPYAVPEREGADLVILGRQRPLYRFTRYHRAGDVQAASILDGDETGAGWLSAERETGLFVEDLRLVEYALSVCSAACWLWKELGWTGGAYARAALVGAAPLQVRRFSPAGRIPFEPQQPVTDRLETRFMEIEHEVDTAPELARRVLTRLLDMVGLADAMGSWWRDGRFQFPR